MSEANESTGPQTDVALLVQDERLPDWVPRGDGAPTIIAFDPTSREADLAGVLETARAALIDAAVGAPLSVARRVHRLRPSAQLVLVAPAATHDELRRTLTFTPGVGEIWIVEQDAVTVELLQRAVAVGAQRDQHTHRAQQVALRVSDLAPQTDRRPFLADQYLATLIELLPEPVLALDDAGNLLFANPAAAEILRLDRGQTLDAPELNQRLAPAAPTEFDALLERARHQAVRVELDFHPADVARTYDVGAAPVAGERPVRAIVLHDVTEQVQARERLQEQAQELELQAEEAQQQNEQLQALTEELEAQAEELQSQADELVIRNNANAALAAESTAVLGNIADGVLIVDGDGRITFANDAAERIHGGVGIGVPVFEWAATHGLLDLNGKAYDSRDLPLARALLQDETVRDAEWLIRRSDGSTVRAQGSAAPVKDREGRKLGAVLTLRDVTEQRNREDEREHLLEERDRALDAQREVMRQRSRFYASMSHELRTPINAIMGYNELMLEEVYGEVAPEQRVALDRVQSAAKHLLELINDVLDLSKIEAGKLRIDPEPVVIGELISDLLATMKPLADASDAELRIDVVSACDGTFVTDPRRLRQILMNLLSNAVRYGAGSPVDLRCSLTDGRLLIEVEDRGPGIPGEMLDQIFTEFVQLGGAELGGTGLGLAIAKSLSASLGGELSAESEVGVGSTFRVELPQLEPA